MATTGGCRHIMDIDGLPCGQRALYPDPLATDGLWSLCYHHYKENRELKARLEDQERDNQAIADVIREIASDIVDVTSTPVVTPDIYKVIADADERAQKLTGLPDSIDPNQEVTSIPEPRPQIYVIPHAVKESFEEFKEKYWPKSEAPMFDTELKTRDPLFRSFNLTPEGVRKVNQIGLAFAELHKVLNRIIGANTYHPDHANAIDLAQMRLRLQEAKMWATRAASVLPENQQ